VSEPFTYKHHLKTGDFITLSLGATQASFRIADIYYDYSSERGSILMDRQTMLRYLPDPAPSNLAIYLSADAPLEAVRAESKKPPPATAPCCFRIATCAPKPSAPLTAPSPSPTPWKRSPSLSR